MRLVLRNIVLQIYEYHEERFDRRRNIDTADGIPVNQMYIQSENRKFAEGYYCTPKSVLRRFLSVLPADVSDFVFVDIGSGKGRPLFCASEFNFKRIVGLEFSEELHQTCLSNIQSFNSSRQKCRCIESILVDAAEYQFPDENLAIFMFNPFRPEVLEKVMTNLGRAHAASGKKIYLGYYNPRYSEFVESQEFLEPISAESPILFVSVHAIWPLGIFESKNPEDWSRNTPPNAACGRASTARRSRSLPHPVLRRSDPLPCYRRRLSRPAVQLGLSTG